MPRHIYHEIFFAHNPRLSGLAQYDFRIEPDSVEWNSTRDEDGNRMMPPSREKLKISLPDRMTQDQQDIHFSDDGADKDVLFCHAFNPPYSVDEIRQRTRGSQDYPMHYGSRLIILGAGKTMYFLQPYNIDVARKDDFELKSRDLGSPLLGMYWSKKDLRLLVHTRSAFFSFDQDGKEIQE